MFRIGMFVVAAFIAFSFTNFASPPAYGQGAIERANQQKRATEERERLIKTYDFSPMFVGSDKIEVFQEAVYSDLRLQGALKKARDASIRIVVTDKFIVEAGWISLDIQHTEKEQWIAYLESQIKEAVRKQNLAKSLKEQERAWGIGRFGIGIDEFASFLNRVKENPTLKDALLEAKKMGVHVFASYEFMEVPSGSSVSININATDDKIVSFLLGR